MNNKRLYKTIMRNIQSKRHNFLNENSSQKTVFYTLWFDGDYLNTAVNPLNTFSTYEEALNSIDEDDYVIIDYVEDKQYYRIDNDDLDDLNSYEDSINIKGDLFGVKEGADYTSEDMGIIIYEGFVITEEERLEWIFGSLREFIYDGYNTTSAEYERATADLHDCILSFYSNILNADDALIGKIIKETIQSGIDEFTRNHKITEIGKASLDDIVSI